MTETEATIEILDKICLKGLTEVSGTESPHGRSWYMGLWIKLEDGGFTLPPYSDRWKKYRGFEMLERLAEISPVAAAKLAEPMK